MAAMISQGRALVEHANRPVTVLLVDQHAMVREELSRILAAEASIAVVGSVGEGPEALALAVRLRPDVVILDADLPDVTGLMVHLTADVPAVGVLLLPTSDDALRVVALVCAGARGYISKHATGQDLIGAVNAVSRGELALEAAALKAVVGQLAHHQGSVVGVADAPYEILSARELEVLRLLCQGRTDKSIAQTLYLSVRTVNSHVSHIYAKLGTRTRTEAMHVALEHGLVSLSESLSLPEYQQDY